MGRRMTQTMRTWLVGATILAAVLAASGLWWRLAPGPQASEPDPAEAPLPVPPVPPRIADSEAYDTCLSMLNADPAGADAFAQAWTDGGDGAAHCQALAQVALGNPETGAEMMETLAKASRGPAVARASIYGQAGQAWMMAGAPDRALAAESAALALSPDDADLLIDRAVAAAALDRPGQAVEDTTRAIEIDPRRADAWVLRGAARRQQNRLDLARSDIDRAVALDPENPEALLERGILRQRRGDRTGARADWEAAIALAPDSDTADLAQQNLSLLEAGPDRR